MGSPAFDNSVTDLESFCGQLSTAIGALNAALPDLQADARGYDTLLQALRPAFDAAESAATALDGGVERDGDRVAKALAELATDAESGQERAQALDDAALALAEEAGGALAEHARLLDEGWRELWSEAWSALTSGLEQRAADVVRWTERADVEFEALDRVFEEAREAIEHEKDETLDALRHAGDAVHDADIALQGLHLHAPTVEDELESAFEEQSGSAEDRLGDWEQRLAAEATLTRSAVETLGAAGDSAVGQERARLAAALDALTAELELIDLALGQAAADLADGRDRAEQAAGLEPELEKTEARVAQIRALMASFEPT